MCLQNRISEVLCFVLVWLRPQYYLKKNKQLQMKQFACWSCRRQKVNVLCSLDVYLNSPLTCIYLHHSRVTLSLLNSIVESIFSPHSYYVYGHLFRDHSAIKGERENCISQPGTLYLSLDCNEGNLIHLGFTFYLMRVSW